MNISYLFYITIYLYIFVWASVFNGIWSTSIVLIWVNYLVSEVGICGISLTYNYSSMNVIITCY
jgi:hypothetical protein